MKIINGSLRLFFLCCLALSISTLAFHAADWETYTSTEGKFTIHVPGTLTSQIDTAQTAIGPVVCNNLFYHHKSDTTQSLYTISYCNYPAATLHSDSTELVDLYFANTVESMQNALKGELLYQSPDRVHQYPAHLWKISYDNGEKSAKFKTVIADNRLYVLQVRTTNHPATLKDANRFLDSFRIIRTEESGFKANK